MATMVAIVILAIQRLGLLAITVAFFILFVVGGAILTFDPSRWFFADATLLALVPIALALYGFYVSRGGEPMFGGNLLDYDTCAVACHEIRGILRTRGLTLVATAHASKLKADPKEPRNLVTVRGAGYRLVTVG